MTIKVKTDTKYVTSDGSEFESFDDASHWEEVCIRQNNPYTKYLDGYNGQALLDKYTLDTYGIWEVSGEDPNADFGGHHHNPFLGYYEGTLDNVIMEVVNLKSFFVWGYGGKIKKIDNIKKV